MKSKFTLMWRAAVALVMVLSLSLVMAVPVAAAHTPTVTLEPGASKASTSVVFTLTVENGSSGDAIVGVTLDVPPSGSGGSNYNVTAIGEPTDWTEGHTSDAYGRPDVITWTATGGGIALDGSQEFTFTATTPSTQADYDWDWTTTDDNATTPVTEEGTATTSVDDTPPTLDTIAWTDADSSTDINIGDTLLLTFSEDMDTSTITNGTLATRLPLSDGSYGDGATVDWGTPAGDDILTVTLGTDVDIPPEGATVNPTSDVTDVAGNSDATEAPGPEFKDNVGPTLDTIAWTDADSSTDINIGDTLLLTFSEDMDTSTITNGTLATRLPLSDGSYGDGATVDWGTPAGDDILTVTLGTDVNIPPAGATVNPTDSVKDLAGNADATTGDGPAFLDDASPILRFITWADMDSSAGINAGDMLIFGFSETMDTSTITHTNIGTTLPTSGSHSYGAVTADDLSWNDPDNDILSVTLGTGTNIEVTETVNPSSGVTDAAGNPDATTGDGPAIVQVTVWLLDGPLAVSPGQPFTIPVNISEIVDFDAASYNVMYDSEVLELTGIIDGTIDSTDIPVVATNDLYAGDVLVGVRVVQNVSGNPGVSGSGILAELCFTYTGPSGTGSPIALENGTLSDKNGNEIYANWFSAGVYADDVLGDANGDGEVDALDITAIELIVAGVNPPTPGADANGDSFINALDITAVEILVATG